ncbi:hypothetical protein ACFQV2_24325 [Actinokineospora soli]|uniref:Uncharacterized protein n=1 Tax=Actinokineospora soli TaxID=1048753 RepID=A0ABW2TQS4_9PSEU
MASQMSTPIFDELLREMTAAAATEAAQAPKPPEPKQAEPQAAGGRRRKPE